MVEIDLCVVAEFKPGVAVVLKAVRPITKLVFLEGSSRLLT